VGGFYWLHSECLLFHGWIRACHFQGGIGFAVAVGSLCVVGVLVVGVCEGTWI